MQNILSLLTLAAGAGALAVPASFEKRADQTFTSNHKQFDDLTTNIAVPQLFPVGLYNGLAWGGVVVLRPIEGLASVVPHSKPQHAGAAGPLDLLQLGQLTLNTFAQAKAGSGVRSFDLKSFWYGFGTDTGTTAGLAQPGTLYVIAYDVNGNQVPTTTFSYVPDKTINGDLVLGTFPDTYRNLQNVTFAVASSEPISERTYIALDDVTHVNHLA
ncbi:hypothetical protein K431DRAFT_291705 [Polychaeton citri CBS 116435]|uniref:Uncharacterized protein n=1 Tax=Polychaeton citri CBS 116435 TaxID=1314669 RepID=A0A9P4QCC5_9PEZI|nr:hypothetical protein K431DRAFT_291705 [Polychaeton citri CBS 116435]